MVEIKDRNHKGKQGAYTADDHARHSFLKRTALPGLRWGKVPGEHDQRMLFLGHLKTLSDASDKAQLQAWVDAHNRTRKRKSLLADRQVQRSILEWASINTSASGVRSRRGCDGDDDNCSRSDRCDARHEHDGRHHARGRAASAERGRGGRNGRTGRCWQRRIGASEGCQIQHGNSGRAHAFQATNSAARPALGQGTGTRRA